MKKIMYFAAALLVLAGCNKNSQENKENAPANYGTITGKIELPQSPNKITAPEGWKAMPGEFTMQWESMDQIYIYNQTEYKQLALESIDQTTGNATFTGDLLSDMSQYNVAYGYNPMAGTTDYTVAYIENNYRPFAWGTGEYNIFTIGNFGPVMGFKLQGTLKVSKIEVVALKGTTTKATYTMTMGTAIELNSTPKTIYFPLNDLGDADKLKAKFYQENVVVKTQEFVTLPAKNLVTTYPEINIDRYNGHAYVDLGLPSGLKWATMNVGATAPQSYGDYYTWGETTTKANYSKATCTYNDNPAVLPADHDAASVNWNGLWRMPTRAEWTELKNNCTWTWTTNYNSTGVAGYIVSKNSKSIFLPAAGWRDSALKDGGTHGNYWSSSCGDSERVRYFHFHATFHGDYDNTGYSGHSVRPVCQ